MPCTISALEKLYFLLTGSEVLSTRMVILAQTPGLVLQPARHLIAPLGKCNLPVPKIQGSNLMVYVVCSFAGTPGAAADYPRQIPASTKFSNQVTWHRHLLLHQFWLLANRPNRLMEIWKIAHSSYVGYLCGRHVCSRRHTFVFFFLLAA